MRREIGFPNCGLLWAIALLARSKGTLLCVIEVFSTVGYGSRHEVFAGYLLWHVTGRDQGVAKLSSLWGHRNVHNHMQKTMGGHLEKRIREHVMAIL